MASNDKGDGERARSRARWREAIDARLHREHSANQPGFAQSVTELAELTRQLDPAGEGIHRSTLISWMKATTDPDPVKLQLIAAATGLPVAYQMELLGWIPRHEQVITGQRDIELPELIREATAALQRESEQRSGHPVAEFVERLLEHSPDRWDVRLLPFVEGERYPRASTLMAEIACRGRALSWDELEARAVGGVDPSTGLPRNRDVLPYWEVLKGRYYRQAEQRRPADDPETDEGKRVRAELRALTVLLEYPDAGGVFQGETKTSPWNVLLAGHPRREQRDGDGDGDGPAYRHVLVGGFREEITPRAIKRKVRVDMPAFGGRGSVGGEEREAVPTQLVFVGPNLSKAAEAGRELARALGWGFVDLRSYTDRRWGRYPAFSNRQSDNAAEALRSLTTDEARSSQIIGVRQTTLLAGRTLNREDPLPDDDPLQALHELVRRENRRAEGTFVPRVLFIYVRPPMEVLRSWEWRQILNKPSSPSERRTASLSNQSEAVRGALISFEKLVADVDRVGCVLPLTYDPPPGGYALPDNTDVGPEDRRIGDAAVRISYEALRWLMNADAPKDPKERPWNERLSEDGSGPLMDSQVRLSLDEERSDPRMSGVWPYRLQHADLGDLPDLPTLPEPSEAGGRSPT